jgi:hypothetical protein
MHEDEITIYHHIFLLILAIIVGHCIYDYSQKAFEHIENKKNFNLLSKPITNKREKYESE